MKRRDILKGSLLLGAASLGSSIPRLYAAPDEGYAGRLLVTVQCDGGWDVTNFCDPKLNQPGEKEITQWSKDADIQVAGNIQYAPIGNNQSFFESYFQDMLVINGVDMQTNSHTTGVLHNWSGRNKEGYPTITSLFAANSAPEQPLSYLNFGGYSETANLIRYSRLKDLQSLVDVLNTRSMNNGGETPIRTESDMSRIRMFQREKTDRLLSSSESLHRYKLNLGFFNNALTSKTSLSRLTNFLPEQSDMEGLQRLNSKIMSSLRDQVRLTVSALASGLTSASDLWLGYFDTHNDNEFEQALLLSHLTDALQLFWQQAEEKGFADRVTMLIGSDFGRTPHYNSNNGKDHWPIGSVIVMEKNASWTNRVVGQTDEGHNALSINPKTLERDDRNGSKIHPQHVHKALRRHLGIENSIVEQNFTLAGADDFAFFE